MAIWKAEIKNTYDNDFVLKQMELDKFGNILLLLEKRRKHGSGLTEITLLKYNKEAKQLWKAEYKPGNWNKSIKILAFKLDNHGNSYITGWENSPDYSLDCFLLKIDSSGQRQWVNYYTSGSGLNDETGKQLILDTAGFVYVACEVKAVQQQKIQKLDLLKYSERGTLIWTTHYLPGNSEKAAFTGSPFLGLDKFSNILLATHTDWSLTDKIVELACLSKQDGRALWRTSSDVCPDKNSTGCFAEITGVITDKHLGIFVAGITTVKTARGDYRKVVTMNKYNEKGINQWSYQYMDSAFNSTFDLHHLIIDENDNLLIAGACLLAQSMRPLLLILNKKGELVFRENGDGQHINSCYYQASMDHDKEIFTASYRFQVSNFGFDDNKRINSHYRIALNGKSGKLIWEKILPEEMTPQFTLYYPLILVRQNASNEVFVAYNWEWVTLIKLKTVAETH